MVYIYAMKLLLMSCDVISTVPLVLREHVSAYRQ
jgi:hypothetical protein